MTDQAISPLRRRMIEDMTIRKFAPKTQQGYIRTIKNLAAFIGRSPDTANFEDVRRFQLHVVGSGVGIGALNQTVAALRPPMPKPMLFLHSFPIKLSLGTEAICRQPTERTQHDAVGPLHFTSQTSFLDDIAMTSHMPPVPPANRSNKAPGSDPESNQDTSVKHPIPKNAAEQGETANIKQNTTNKGYFHGRRMK